MSLLRLSRPGYPPQFIDLGPNHARVTSKLGIRGGSVSGSLAVGVSRRTEANRQTREYKARRRLYAGEDLTAEEREARRREYFREWQRERRALGLRIDPRTRHDLPSKESRP